MGNGVFIGVGVGGIGFGIMLGLGGGGGIGICGVCKLIGGSMGYLLYVFGGLGGVCSFDDGGVILGLFMSLVRDFGVSKFCVIGFIWIFCILGVII